MAPALISQPVLSDNYRRDRAQAITRLLDEMRERLDKMRSRTILAGDREIPVESTAITELYGAYLELSSTTRRHLRCEAIAHGEGR